MRHRESESQQGEQGIPVEEQPGIGMIGPSNRTSHRGRHDGRDEKFHKED